MADESEIVKSPITDIIKNSIMEYATNKKRKMPREVEQIINSDNSRWHYAGFDNITCEYLFESKDGKEVIKYNYKTKELLSYNSEEMFHRFFNPVNKAWEIYIPRKGMHYNIKTNRWEYYNVATDEWLGQYPKAYVKDAENDENNNYTVSYDKEKNIYKYNSKEVSAIYIVEDKVWAIHNKVTDKTAYISATNGKEMTLDEESGKFDIKENPNSTLDKSKTNDVETKENSKAEDSKVDDSKSETKTQDSKEDTVQKENENNKKTSNDNNLALTSTRKSLFSRVKNWFKEKISSLKSSENSSKNEPEKQSTNVLNEEKRYEELGNLLDNIIKDNEETPEEKIIYRSEATKKKMIEKEIRKMQRKLKLAEFSKGLRFTDTKKSIALIAASGVFALGATVNLVYEGLNTSHNRSAVSISENVVENKSQEHKESDIVKENKSINKGNNNQEAVNTNKQEEQIKVVQTAEKVDKTNIYMVPAGTTYTSSSKGDGTKGVFKEDTSVGIYNRAIVRTDEDGSKEIVLSTDGKTWEEYSKNSGISMEEIEKAKNTEGNIEMVAVSVPNTNSISDTYGWIESKGLKELEVTIGDNTQLLQNLIEHEGER